MFRRAHFFQPTTRFTTPELQTTQMLLFLEKEKCGEKCGGKMRVESQIRHYSWIECVWPLCKTDSSSARCVDMYISIPSYKIDNAPLCSARHL